MKQNERMLVYAVTGFLVLILVIAVVFGSEPNAAAGKPGGAKGIEELIDGSIDGSSTGGKAPIANGSQTPSGQSANGAPATGASNPASGNPASGNPGMGNPGMGNPSASGLVDASLLRTEQPLVARPQAVADIVAQRLGASRRDHTVRFVRARAGDSLSTLVQRWCGAIDPYLEEARALNEELRVVQVGQEVAVPWIDDEQLVAQLDLQTAVPAGPRTLIADPAVGRPGGTTTAGGDRLADMLNGAGLNGAGLNGAGLNSAGASPRPDFQLPNGMVGAGSPGTGSPATGSPATGSPANGAAPGTPGATAPSAATTSYTVKSGDSLWAIAARRYGRKNADRMVQQILAINTGASETLKVGQVLQLPPTE